MVNIESNRIYISFVLLFTVLFVCTILMITPAPVLKHAQATSGGEDEGDDGHEDMGGDKGDDGHEDMGGDKGDDGHEDMDGDMGDEGDGDQDDEDYEGDEDYEE